MPKVTKIPATRMMFSSNGLDKNKKRRVAAYARVSTDSDEQFTSYEAQVDYYTNLINGRSDWEFVKVYADEGISGLNRKNRVGFNTMITDALAGKIDLILTKSISRFARNTVDTLTTIRELKERSVEVFFEKENIYTFDGKGELLITIMGSLAQEESRSISENITWGMRKRFSDGNYSWGYSSFLGYDKGVDGKPVINQKEAEVVRLIYDLYLCGKSIGGIKQYLEEKCIPSPTGCATWPYATINSILSNEKYKGDALLQKKFTINFLEKKLKANDGEVPQYYVENGHPGIITEEDFELVKLERERRRKIGNSYSGKSIFSSRLFCGECGGMYGSKTWHSKDKYKKVVWQCNNKFSGAKCQTPTLTEENIKKGFLKAYEAFIRERIDVIQNCKMLYAMVSDTGEILRKIADTELEIEILTQKEEVLRTKNTTKATPQDEYNKEYEKLLKQYEAKKKQLDDLAAEKASKEQRSREIEVFIQKLEQAPDEVLKWDNRLFITLCDKGVVETNGDITFIFKDGSKIRVNAN